MQPDLCALSTVQQPVDGCPRTSSSFAVQPVVDHPGRPGKRYATSGTHALTPRPMARQHGSALAMAVAPVICGEGQGLEKGGIWGEESHATHRSW